MATHLFLGLISFCFQGLADIILEEQTSFTIVSNGADCVLINKQFYLENASEKLLRKLRQDVSLFYRPITFNTPTQYTKVLKAVKTDIFR